MSKIFLFPQMLQQEKLDNIVCRLAWYFKPYLNSIEAIHFTCTRKKLDAVKLPVYLDPAIERELPALKDKIHLLKKNDFLKVVADSDPQRDLILIWDESAETTAPVEVLSAIDKAKKKSGFWRVDPLKTRMEGSYYLHAGWNKFTDRKETIDRNKKKFREMAKDIGHHKKAYIYGTGPSLSDFAENHDFSDGLSVISNSIVKNQDILEKTQPRIIVAADPLYHAGCSSYAGEFREALIEAMRKTIAYFLCPMRDYQIYEAFLPGKLKDKVIGIPFEKNVPPTTSLLEEFKLKPYPNILTLMLLPVASTFADSISIVGCDGRRITDDAFFWSHDKKAQFNEKMGDIQKTHPAFFAINYNDYYFGHCRDLEETLATLEAAGKDVVTETPSLIPALNAREVHPLAHYMSSEESCVPGAMVIVDPDAKGAWGHFLHYDRKFAVESRNMGFNTALIACHDLDPELARNYFQNTIHVLTHHSWNYGNNSNPASKEDALASFVNEMDQAMDRLEATYTDGIICIYMYVGCVEVAEILEHILVYRPRFRAFVNLFWSYNFDHQNPEYRNLWLPILRRINNTGRVFLSHLTSQISMQYRSDWDLDVPVLPHPSTTFNDEEASYLSHFMSFSESSSTIRVLYPGGARKKEGFTLSPGSSEIVSKIPGMQVVFCSNLNAARENPGKNFGSELIESFDNIDKTGMEIIDSNLSDDEFIEMIASCDIVVIPDPPEAFSRRTSGILADSLILGKPVVAIEGTWLEDIVKKEGIGVCAKPTVQSLASSVFDVAKNLKSFEANIARAQSRYLMENSWRALVTQIAERLCKGKGGPGSVASSMKPPSVSIVDRVISVNPDAESFFGHFLNYEARLGRAVRRRSVQHLIAGPVDAEPQVYASHPEMERVFSVRTNKLYANTAGETVPDLKRFANELDRYLYRLDPRTETLLFMYCGSLEIAEVFSGLADKYPSCTFAISLYYLSWLDLTLPDLRAYWKPRLMAMEQHPRIRLIVPSPELANTLKTHFGVSPEILPHPSTSFHDSEVRAMGKGGTEQSNDGVTVVFPGNQRGGKGYELTRDAIKALLAANIEGLNLRVRRPPDDSYGKQRREFFDSIRDRVEVLDSYLNEEAFQKLLLSADLIVLPYTADRFGNRTSGLLVDALLLGIPCVVIENTWLAGMVQKYSFGQVSPDNGKELASVVREALGRIPYFKKAALNARNTYIQTNSWSSLVDFLLTPPQSVNHPTHISSVVDEQSTEHFPTILPSKGTAAMNKSILLIGNGPSTRVLAEAGFHKIPADMDTFGTTTAFRYFERIGWWPTYYALADRKVVFHHREKFAQLLEDPTVSTKRFFLSCKVSDSDRLEVIPHSSTGSFALKKAIELGYQEIYLIGMDGAYVEEIKESRPLTDEEIEKMGFSVLNLTKAESKLRIITNTPDYNPNYFFDDYQQAGDVYSLPQAHTHINNWQKVAQEAKSAGVQIYNLSRISRITAFKKVDIFEVLNYFASDCWDNLKDPFHGIAEGTLQSAGIKRNGSVSLDRETYTLTPLHSDNWIACAYRGHIAPSKTVSTRVSFSLNTDCTLNVMLCRDGSTPFENASQKVSLTKGVHTLTLRHTFKHDHQGALIQIGVVDKPVTISDISSEMSFVHEKDKGVSKLSSKSAQPSVKPDKPVFATRAQPEPVKKPQPAGNTIYLLGNGPSLREFEFTACNGSPTLGMNIAFRQWQRTNWYPDYYICMDTVVTESQKEGIFELVQNKAQNGIRLFMLRKNILKFHPQLKDDPSVLFFEDYMQSPYFDEAKPLTTGSHAALFGAMLGYKRICLLGIDCNYVQQIPEAKKVKGHVLEMTRTPDKNPNYFFDDYQQKGDSFNIPDSHPNLHYRSWVMVKERMEKFGVDVINCNPKSKLDMFDYVPLEKVLGKR